MRARLIGPALVLASAAWAQAPPPPALPAAPGQYLVQSLLSLLVVVALIVGVTWLLRRMGPGRVSAGQRGPAELVQSLPLHGAYMLHVVRIDGKLTGIICGPGGVAAVDVPDTPAATVASADEGVEE